MLQSMQNQQPVDVESWTAINRFAGLFDQKADTDNFSASCSQTFGLAINACQEGRWKKLSQFGEDMAKLSRCWKTSLLNYAVSQGEDAWVKQLIHHKVDIQSKDLEGNTPLHSAAKRGATYLLDILYAHISVDSENHRQQTALHVAIDSGQHQFVAALINKGANLHHLAPIDDQAEIVLDAIGFAVVRGEIACIDELMKSGDCNLKYPYQKLGYLLHVAIYFHQVHVLNHLLEKYKSQFDLESRNQNNLTPLSFAASLGEFEAIQVLHRFGASLDPHDNKKRYPIHHAALGCHHETIQFLAFLGAKIDPIDKDHKRPLDLVEAMQGDLAQSCANLLKSLKNNKQVRKFAPTPHLAPPTNLVFRGGGPKGLVYVGALAALEKENLLQSVERVAGTSAGAITAAFLAINYPIDKLTHLLKTTDLVGLLLDHPLSKQKLKDAFHEATKDFSSVLGTLQSVWDICKNPTKLITAPLKALYQCTGICDGEMCREWLENMIREHTGISYCTFGDLAEGIKNGKLYKHLHVYGINVGKDTNIAHIHSNDPQWKDVIISDAVRISMSIPGVFKPHIIHIKSNGLRVPAPAYGSFLDGGMLYNFPIEAFDEKQYFTREDLGGESRCPKFNKRTLGFSLFSSLDKKNVQSKNVENVFDLLSGICHAYLGAEEAIRQLNPYNRSRVIEIDVRDVGTLSFKMSDEKKEEMLLWGKEAVTQFINNSQFHQLPETIMNRIAESTRGIFEKGFNLKIECNNENCDAFQKVAYIKRGIGSFNVAEEECETSCSKCNKTPTIDINKSAFFDCIYSIKGRMENGSLFEQNKQISSNNIAVTVEAAIGKDNMLEKWKFVKITTESANK